MFKCKEKVLLKCYIVVFHCPRWYICLEIIDISCQQDFFHCCELL